MITQMPIEYIASAIEGLNDVNAEDILAKANSVATTANTTEEA